MHEYKIEIVRDGRWWMVHVPEIDGVTQARRLSEAETMAREYIALDQGVPYDEIKVETASIRMAEPEFRELLDGARSIKELREKAAALDNQATKDAHEYVHWLLRCSCAGHCIVA